MQKNLNICLRGNCPLHWNGSVLQEIYASFVQIQRTTNPITVDEDTWAHLKQKKDKHNFLVAFYNGCLSEEEIRINY